MRAEGAILTVVIKYVCVLLEYVLLVNLRTRVLGILK